MYIVHRFISSKRQSGSHEAASGQATGIRVEVGTVGRLDQNIRCRSDGGTVVDKCLRVIGRLVDRCGTDTSDQTGGGKPQT